MDTPIGHNLDTGLAELEPGEVGVVLGGAVVTGLGAAAVVWFFGWGTRLKQEATFVLRHGQLLRRESLEPEAWAILDTFRGDYDPAREYHVGDVVSSTRDEALLFADSCGRWIAIGQGRLG